MEEKNKKTILKLFGTEIIDSPEGFFINGRRVPNEFIIPCLGEWKGLNIGGALHFYNKENRIMILRDKRTFVNGYELPEIKKS